MATQRDTLITEFKVVDQAAVQSIDNYYKKLDNTAAKLSDVEKRSADAALAVRSNFEKALNASLTQTHNLSQELRNLQNQPIGRGLDAAIQRAATLRTRIQEIRTAAASTQDAKVLDGLIADARTAQTELTELENKVRRVTSGRAGAQEKAAAGGRFNAQQTAGLTNLARQGADVFTGLASGQSPALIAIQQGPQILDALATSGFQFSAAMAASAITIGGIVGPAIVVASWISEWRAEADAFLKNVEKVQGAINKAILDQKKAVEDLAEARKNAAADRQLQRDLAKGDIQDLERQKALLEKFRELSPTGPNADRQQQQIIAIDAQLEAIKLAQKPAGSASFEAANEAFKQRQEFERKQAEELETKIKAATEKLTEYGKAAQDLFGGLFAGQGENNPFVKVFDDAEKAIEKTRKSTALLNDELKATAEGLTATANANRLFGTRLDNSLRASDLRADAASFRGRGSSPAEILAALQAGGVGRNEQLFFSSFGAGRRLDSFNALREMEQAGGLFRNPDFDNQIRRRLQDEEPSARERFNRQLEVVRGLSPQNEEQRAIADRKIIELSRGLNPDDLSAADRDAVATALENEAVRAENAEKDAKEKDAKRDKINEAINDNIAELLKIAKSDGLTGVIRIINEAENQARVSLGKRPTESDMQSRTE